MMLCYISQPNSYALEVEVDTKANGQECLDKVCEQLGIVEEDYFGIQYIGNKGEHLWLNMRNRIEHQLSGSAPYCLQLRVKFYVQPHFILQDSTRHQFYLQVKHDLHLKKISLRGDNDAVQIMSLMGQAEFGDHKNSYQWNLYNKLLHGIADLSPELLHRIAMKHASLQGMTKTSAKYHLLQDLSTHDGYGVEYHDAKTTEGHVIHVGVGPEGIFLYGPEMQPLQRIAFPVLKLATVNGRSCVLRYWEDDGEELITELKLVSNKTASAFYRSVTEMKSFFFCDTVMDVVYTQYSRDLKGTIISLFNENSSLGKQFIFDIKRTGREAYDHARRMLYTQTQISQEQQQQQDMELDNADNANCDTDICDNDKSKIYKEKLAKTIKESFACQLCVEGSMSIVFCPCGHMVCCEMCSQRLELCPICRRDIETRQLVYLPEVSLTET